MRVWTKREALSLNKDRPPVVTRNRRSRGLTTRRALPGKLFLRRAKTRNTATALVSVKHAWRTPRLAAYRSRPSPRRRQPHAAVQSGEMYRARSTLQRVVSLHRQFGAFDRCGSDLEQARCGEILRLQRGKPT